MKEEWILVIPCGDQVIDTILKLKSLGYKVIGVDENPNAIGFQYCDLNLIAPINDYEKILSFISNNKLNVICAIPIVSDKAVFPSYILNLHLGNTKPNSNILAFFSKSYLRNLFENSIINCNPNFFTFNTKDIDVNSLGLNKFIIKPDDSSGSRGVNIVDSDTKQYFNDYINEAFSFSSNGTIVIEEYVEGEEYMVDCFVDHFEVLTVLVSKKYKIEDKVSYLIKSIPNSTFPNKILEDFLLKIVQTLKYQKGPLHIEIKYKDNKFYILDLAARGGGFGVFNYYTKKCLEFDFVEANINAYLNKKIEKINNSFKYGAMYFVRPEKSGILNEVIVEYNNKDNHEVKIDYFYKKGQFVNLEVNDGNRLVGIYCFAESELILDRLLNDIIKTIKQTYL